MKSYEDPLDVSPTQYLQRVAKKFDLNEGAFEKETFGVIYSDVLREYSKRRKRSVDISASSHLNVAAIKKPKRDEEGQISIRKRSVDSSASSNSDATDIKKRKRDEGDSISLLLHYAGKVSTFKVKKKTLIRKILNDFGWQMGSTCR